MVNLDGCNGSCNTFPSKTEGVNIDVFNVIARTNKLKTLTKHFMQCKCIFDGRKDNSNRNLNNKNVDVSGKI